jgi:hypothetical protein
MTTTKSARRARRIAADEAHAWARNLRLGNNSAKHVLKALTMYVEGEGCCFVGIDHLADDCDMSPDTVRRRLVWLEQVGAISRIPQWLDNRGLRNGDGRGKRTTDLIRLLTETEPADIEARARGDGGDAPDGAASDDDATDGISPRNLQGLNSEAEKISPRLAPAQPSQCCDHLISEPEPESPPKSPLRGALDPASDQEQARRRAVEQRFRDSYPFIGTMDQEALWSALDELAIDDAEWAAEAIGGYRIELSELKKPPKNAHLWVAKGMFRNYPRGAARPATAAPELPWIAEGSAEDRVITWLHRRAGVPKPFVTVGPDGKRGYRAKRPIGPDAMAMAAHLDDRVWRYQTEDEAGGAPPQRVWLWPFFAQGAPEFAAWQRRFRDWTGGGLPIERDDAGQQGIRAPRQWPPRVDGTWAEPSAHPPPDDATTADDEQALAGEGEGRR